MSDSEDDFMSDKFLVEAPTKPSTSTYSQRRNAQQLKSFRAGQANNKLSTKQLEEQRRREGLNTSLFDRSQDVAKSGDGQQSSASTSGGGGQAMNLMMKMGWKVGEGLGRKRSPSPRDDTAKRQKQGAGIGSSGNASSEAGPSSRPSGRTEPIRVSLWAGRKGLTARSPSPPPLPPSHQNPDVLDPKKMERLTNATEDFRARQRKVFGDKETERKEWKAREMLQKFDLEKGVKFHPLHVMPSDPLGTIPKPLLRLIYPAQVLSPSPSRSPSPEPIVTHEREENLSAAAKMRERLRRDMLSELGGEDDEDEDGLAFGPRSTDNILARPSKPGTVEGGNNKEETGATDHKDVDWDSHVSGTKRVLSMDPATHLEYLLSQLRHEHFFCFWCAFKYSSHEEMEAPGGCPGEDEDDH